MSIKLNLKPENLNTPNNFWSVSSSNPYVDENIAQITDDTADVEIPVTSIPSSCTLIKLFTSTFTVPEGPSVVVNSAPVKLKVLKGPVNPTTST